MEVQKVTMLNTSKLEIYCWTSVKYCFAKGPNWWDFTDLTFLTWEDTRQRLDIAECTTNLCSLLSNLCCVCLNDICLECSNKAFIDGWDDYEIQIEINRSDGKVFWKYLIYLHRWHCKDKSMCHVLATCLYQSLLRRTLWLKLSSGGWDLMGIVWGRELEY